MKRMKFLALSLGIMVTASSLAAEPPPPSQPPSSEDVGGAYSQEKGKEVSILGVPIRSFTMSTKSMAPTLLANEILLAKNVDEAITYGDVVVFKKPPENTVDYIKRVVGLPGDSVQMVRGILRINGKDVVRIRVEDYEYRGIDGKSSKVAQYIETLPNGRRHRIIEILGDNGPGDNTREYKVPPGHFFVLGDNRDYSIDSRDLALLGYVPARNIGYFVWQLMRPLPQFIDADFQD
jgi:signal peptidase I